MIHKDEGLQGCSQRVLLGGQIDFFFFLGGGQFIFKPLINHFFPKCRRGEGCSPGGKREFKGAEPPRPPLSTPLQDTESKVSHLSQKILIVNSDGTEFYPLQRGMLDFTFFSCPKFAVKKSDGSRNLHFSLEIVSFDFKIHLKIHS